MFSGISQCITAAKFIYISDYELSMIILYTCMHTNTHTHTCTHHPSIHSCTHHIMWNKWKWYRLGRSRLWCRVSFVSLMTETLMIEEINPGNEIPVEMCKLWFLVFRPAILSNYNPHLGWSHMRAACLRPSVVLHVCVISRSSAFSQMSTRSLTMHFPLFCQWPGTPVITKTNPLQVTQQQISLSALLASRILS